jgi:transcription elongation factor Elf1
MLRQNEETGDSEQAVDERLPRIWECPQCEKHRLALPHGTEPDREPVDVDTPSGKTVKLYKNVCGYCERKYLDKYFRSENKADKTIMDAVKDLVDSGETDVELPDRSIEELL